MHAVMYAESIGCDYVVMNDVDQIPISDKISHEWPKEPVHLCTNTDQQGFTFYDAVSAARMQRCVGCRHVLSLPQDSLCSSQDSLCSSHGMAPSQAPCHKCATCAYRLLLGRSTRRRKTRAGVVAAATAQACLPLAATAQSCLPRLPLASSALLSPMGARADGGRGVSVADRALQEAQRLLEQIFRLGAGGR